MRAVRSQSGFAFSASRSSESFVSSEWAVASISSVSYRTAVLVRGLREGAMNGRNPVALLLDGGGEFL